MAEIIRQKNKERETADVCSIEMQKERILQTLKAKGCRITKQRRMLLDLILQEECTSCKEIYYKAKKEDARIGAATVYRMINVLEEIGVISRKNMYKISCCTDPDREIACVIELDDHTVCQLTTQHWLGVVSEGLKACGYVDKQRVTGIMLESYLKVDD